MFTEEQGGDEIPVGEGEKDGTVVTIAKYGDGLAPCLFLDGEKGKEGGLIRWGSRRADGSSPRRSGGNGKGAGRPIAVARLHPISLPANKLSGTSATIATPCRGANPNRPLDEWFHSRDVRARRLPGHRGRSLADRSDCQLAKQFSTFS